MHRFISGSTKPYFPSPITLRSCVIDWGYCKKYECCETSWTRHAPGAIKQALDENLFGQHLVNDFVPRVILNHISSKEPKKALAISLHGWTGSGKTYVVKFITKLLYFKGFESKYVHRRQSTKHYRDSSKIKEYKNEIQNLVETATKECTTSLFIFEEFDKMPFGLADVLVPYLDFYQEVDGVDFRKNIFIFVSNTGGDVINKEAYSHFKKGKKREEITRFKMQKLLKLVAYQDGGFNSSDLIFLSLIDFFIPFLPLERKHVKECVKVVLQEFSQSVNDDKLVNEIANELQYFPEGDEIFSSTGCKSVYSEVSGLF